jgi:hypothetical protein
LKAFQVFFEEIYLKNFPKNKIIIFSGLSEQIYAPNAIKAGVGYVTNKKS